MIPEPEWINIIEKVKKSRKIILIGEVDSGKSTFAKYLINSLIKNNTPVCFIDSDIGQSSIALPTTIGVKIFKALYNFEEKGEIFIDFDKIYFVGSTTPSICIETFLEEFANAVKFAENFNTTIVTDTTGLVSGDLGKSLKLKKILILEPELVIIFNKKGEIDHIIKEINCETVIFRPSKNVKRRDYLKRAEYRRKKFEKYFENAESFALEKKLIKGTLPKEPVGNIIGLFKNDECLAVGVVEDVDKENIVFFAPLKDLKNINRIKIGYLNLKKEVVSIFLCKFINRCIPPFFI